ncbi:hypothetical protein T265_09756 [Opisthorchis viverrini]|uniref:DUF7041 domain-containing protein n=1 Tax=Opisthorchis viverrini TaxID=6198 RepID=A0A075A3V1_OPIVI|nr:hypothetical protein T265_09756 [Opisthorchis viverrini]KER22069.1 hypothetical protein T265_09756 [Opisthorchis viverrini]
MTEQPMEPPDRTTNRGQRSSPATSTYINTRNTTERTTTNPPLRTTTLPNNALMMSHRLVMKRLQSNCPAQRTNQRPSTLPELQTFTSIENMHICSKITANGFSNIQFAHIASDVCTPGDQLKRPRGIIVLKNQPTERRGSSCFFCPVIMETHFDSADLVENANSMRLPDYNQRNPRVWFHQVEAVFTTRRITSQAKQFSYVVQHLPCDVATEMEDLLEDVPKGKSL